MGPERAPRLLFVILLFRSSTSSHIVLNMSPSHGNTAPQSYATEEESSSIEKHEAEVETELETVRNTALSTQITVKNAFLLSYQESNAGRLVLDPK